MNQPKRSLAYLLIAAIAAGCNAKAERPPVPPRPVSFVTLKTSNPSATTRLTGSAASWKREELAFEVPGRVIRIVEPGANIVGRTLDEKGNPVTEGTQLAHLDEERYQLALKQAESGAAATRTELELQQKQLARYKGIQAENPGAVAQQTIDRYDAAVKGATAKLDVFLSQIDQAKRDIRDCTLVSPFTGQIARVHVIPGGYAYRGIPVLTVQMMDPIKVNIAVSPETDKRINSNDIIHVYTATGEKLEGLVYLKDTFADPTTRTFLVTLLVRNRRIEQGVPDDLREQSIPRCRNLWSLQRPEGQTSGNYYLDVDAIQQDDQGNYVWKAENLTVDQMSGDFSPVVTARKVPVTASEARIPALQIFTFRELTDWGDLDPKKDVIIGGVTGDLEDGGQVILVRERWALRPGDVVRVGLKGEETPEGYYVPSDAIQFDGNSHYVVVAKGAQDGTQLVSFLPVTPGETVGSLQRIEGELEAGTKVIVEGAHYVQVGEQVNPVQEVEVQP